MPLLAPSTIIILTYPHAEDSTFISHRRKIITTEFASRITYPNPFKPTGIEFDLPEDALVTLTLLDHLGNELSQLITDRFYKAGTHTIDLTTNGYSKGIYFYRLSIIIKGKTYTDTKRIVIEH